PFPDSAAWYHGEVYQDTGRLRKILETAAEKSGWGTPLPAGRGRGIAAFLNYGGFVAHVAEVSVDASGNVRVHRVTSAVDCGFAVNPGGVEAQIQSGIVFGLSAALKDEITFKEGRVEQTNYNNYRMLRINEMPVVDVHI